MIDTRLLKLVRGSGKYIFLTAFLQWLQLLCNIVIMSSVAWLLNMFFVGNITHEGSMNFLLIVLVAVVIRALWALGSAKTSYLASSTVKHVLRTKIMEKMLRMGGNYQETVATSEVVQLSTEGVDQLETYFSSYLPQFIYALAAPLTLFVFLSQFSFSAALILFICVPLIPMTIIIVQKTAKKLLAKYWGQYTALGDTFLENLQGLATAKVYQADEMKQKQMNEEAEKFRIITMKVLTMQLNSVSIMDLLAYGGAALGMIMAIHAYSNNAVSLYGCLLIILLAADYFLPMRLLGSYFHIAMNGIASSGKIFAMLEKEEEPKGSAPFPKDMPVILKDVHFSYDESREVLHGINMVFAPQGMYAIVGESGCGKSTIASLLMGRHRHYEGTMRIGERNLLEIDEDSLYQNMTYVGHDASLFAGTLRDNLLAGDAEADDKEMWDVLAKVKLDAWLREEDGLDTVILPSASNLSGGQCQRIAIARALLHDSSIYIFDEASSNIDADSEEIIMQNIEMLARTKMVILISHRLLNVVNAENIFVLEEGNVVESGTHPALLEHDGVYASLWKKQQELEHYAGGAA